MSIVEKLKTAAENYEKSAARNRGRAIEDRASAEHYDHVAMMDDALAAEYRRAAELMEPKTGGITQEASEMTAISGAGIGSCVGTSLHDDSAYHEQRLRDQALEYASRLGGHQTSIIKAADAYYAFLAGADPQKAD